MLNRYRTAGTEPGERMPLTMTWEQQLLQEAEALLQGGRKEAELGAAVQGLALLLHGHLQAGGVEELLLLEEKETVRVLAASKLISSGTVGVLEALAFGRGVRAHSLPGLRGAAFELLHTIRGLGRELPSAPYH
ncbi:hypothetical protein O9H85_25415 [Paenibacillus filicis]|uniref:Uncharacterized protein n=1 Tax=Paenibacillus gyeongsangnamensis TaxID=3388067 RepID=A0ABT4QFM7_9BACL|nr:hypothetical protein [Paenibacillus filicis]MCZ8515689.1 hypothetical protein [Paenibacillus filicis]